MRRRSLILFALLLVVLWTPLTSRAGGEMPINSYTAIHLSHLRAAHDVNDSAQVVGVSEGGFAALWQDGVITHLGGLGGSYSAAYAVNNPGQAAGMAYTAGGQGHAFLWDSVNGMQDLGTLGGTYSSASGLNDVGQVVGYATDANGVNRAFLWQGGRMVDLGVPAGYVSSDARDINEAGQVVGYATDANGVNRAFRWTPDVPNGTTGTMVALHPTAGNAAHGINGAGDAVGVAVDGEVTGVELPTLWDSAGAHALPLLPGWTAGYALANNDSRSVVGYNWWDDGWGVVYFAACVWDSLHGARDLNALAGTWQLEWAPGINGAGQIVTNSQDGSCYLLTPSPLPVPPSGLWATSQDARVELAWEASYGAVSPTTYTVKRSTTSGGPYAVLASGTGTSYTDTAVVNGTTYYYVVSAVNAYGESANSYETWARPVPPPASPTGLTAAAGDMKATLSWNASAWADWYGIYRATTPGGPYGYVGGVGGTSFTDTGLTNGATYHYVVAAWNDAGTSGYSNEASVTPVGPPPPAAPTNLTASTGKGKRRVDLKWTQSTSSGVTQNRIYRSPTSGSGYSLRATVSAGTTFSDTSVTSGTTYYYVVTAVNGSSGKESAYSNQASAKPR